VTKRTRIQILAYLMAVASVTLAAFFTIVMWPILRPNPYLLFFVAVIIAGWRGGTGPGVAAAIVSTIAAELVLSQTYGRFSFAIADFVRLGGYLVVAVLAGHICSLNKSLFERGERLEVTLASIGDGVIATDAHGSVTFMNTVAEALTGWNEEDAKARPLKSVFAIINEETRRPVDNPVERVIQSGAIVGLANHTVLIAKDGTERPIDDSAAPIRGRDGETIGVILIFRDITERRRAERALAQSEERFRTVADSAPVMIWMCASDMRSSFLNNAWFEFTGRKPEQESGEGWQEGIEPEDLPQVRDQFLSAFQARRRFRIEYRLRRMDGVYRWVVNVAVPREEPDGTFAGYIGSVVDVTEIKQVDYMKTALLAMEREARDRAEAANRLKDEFLATVSHELRTPLAAAIGWLHLLRAGSLDTPTATRALDTVYRNTAALKRLVDDLIDISSIVAGHVRVELQPIALEPIVIAAVEAIRPTAEGKGIQITTQIQGAALTVNGDADRLQQVLWNLLSNAVKFTEAGGHVGVVLDRTESFARIEVTDTGRGISRDFLPRMFERFTQEDASPARRHSGLGLGLAIVQYLIALHDGTVRADSPGPGQGATLTVELPLIAP
jgi:PAS domain S-box-containing protein